MSSSLYDHVLQQLRSCSDFLNSLRCCPDEFKATSTLSLVNSIVASVVSLKSLQMAEASALNKAVSESGLSDAHKCMLTTAVAQRLIDGSTLGTAKKTTQTFLHPVAFFTASDWGVFDEASTTMLQKVSRVVERLQLLNVTNPSEETVRHLVAMLAATVQHPCDDSTGLHTIVLDVKAAILPLRNRSAVQQLVMYPASPDLLPQCMMTAAYSTDDPPIFKQLDGMSAILPRIPMRSSNRTIAPHRNQPSSGSSSSSLQPMHWMQQMMQQMMDGAAHMPPPLGRLQGLRTPVGRTRHCGP